MESSFELTPPKLIDIALAFASSIKEGLTLNNAQIKGLVTYVPTGSGPATGQALVVDLGGTRVRAALTDLGPSGVSCQRGPVEALLPVTRGEPLDMGTFLGVQADLVASLDVPDGLPLGYCFSYPAAPEPGGDATLIRWTKEIFVPGTEGRAVGAMLVRELGRRGIKCDGLAVINDTVASLLAGLSGEPADDYIGLIVGTGTNTAALFDRNMIPKFPAGLEWTGPVPVNLESGNFNPPHLTPVDDQIDESSDNPGAQRFEKAVSGAYLGRVLAAALPGSDFDPDSGSAGVVQMAGRSPDGGQAARVAASILERSARLVASSLAGLIGCLGPGPGERTVKIIAEGGLYWGAPGYSAMVNSTLDQLLGELGPTGVTASISSIESANLAGSTLAALSRAEG